MGEASVRAAQAVGYRSAGTVEYLVEGEEFFFLEMNARIQVEHPITEMVLGVDLVREQVRIAAGDALSLRQKDIRPRGHAIECRINAEDASRRFLPAPAPITAYREPSGPGVRVDSGVGPGSALPDLYDPMIAKLVVWDVDRETARRRMLRALDEFVLEGPVTLLPFHRWLLEREEFIAGGTCHALLAELAERPTPIPSPPGARGPAPTAGSDGPGAAPLAERRMTAEVDGRRFEVRLFYEPQGPQANAADARARAPRRPPSADVAPEGGGAGPESITTPMQGTVLRVLVEPGQQVGEGDVLCIVEAMKMENEVVALRAGIVRELNVSEGQAVQASQVIAVVE
jgi:acetyl-CoA/propionyl-CoA carboxylase biotin carboxyl carrier protein